MAFKHGIFAALVPLLLAAGAALAQQPSGPAPKPSAQVPGGKGATPPPGPAAAGPTVAPHLGIWSTDGGKSLVEVKECPPGICANIVWLRDPNDAKGKPLHDGYNKAPTMRARPILGLPLFENMKPAKAGWAGKVYNPEEGEWFGVDVWLAGADKLNIKGCVLFICETHTWIKAKDQKLPAAKI